MAWLDGPKLKHGVVVVGFPGYLHGVKPCFSSCSRAQWCCPGLVGIKGWPKDLMLSLNFRVAVGVLFQIILLI